MTYSAYGTHANYPLPGAHHYALPFNLLADHASAGSLWDPSLNAAVYALDFASFHLPPPAPPPTPPPSAEAVPDPYILHPATLNPNAPTSWFHFDGFWGDRQLPITDHRQFGFAGIKGLWAWGDGPSGPRWKDLGRRNVCLDPMEAAGGEPGMCKLHRDLKEWQGGRKLPI